MKMKMKIKYLNGESWDWLKDYSCEIVELDGSRNGVMSIIKNTIVHYQLMGEYEDSHKVLFDDGYTCISFLPEHENWCVNAVYDSKNQIVEWYFDIIKSKGKDSLGRYYYHDLYLDVVVRPNYEIVLLDEDELKEALKLEVINQKDYELAYAVSERLISEVISDRAFMEDFLKERL